MLTIKNYKLAFQHDAKEGTTKCTIFNQELEPLYVGDSKKSKKDIFNKKVGRKVALTRAVKFLTKEERQEIWNEYFNLNQNWK